MLPNDVGPGTICWYSPPGAEIVPPLTSRFLVKVIFEHQPLYSFRPILVVRRLGSGHDFSAPHWALEPVSPLELLALEAE